MAKSNHLNLTIISLVALVAIVALVALVMNAASVKVSGLKLVQAGGENVLGYPICSIANPTACPPGAEANIAGEAIANDERNLVGQPIFIQCASYDEYGRCVRYVKVYR